MFIYDIIIVYIACNNKIDAIMKKLNISKKQI